MTYKAIFYPPKQRELYIDQHFINLINLIAKNIFINATILQNKIEFRDLLHLRTHFVHLMCSSLSLQGFVFLWSI